VTKHFAYKNFCFIFEIFRRYFRWFCKGGLAIFAMRKLPQGFFLRMRCFLKNVWPFRDICREFVGFLKWFEAFYRFRFFSKTFQRNWGFFARLFKYIFCGIEAFLKENVRLLKNNETFWKTFSENGGFFKDHKAFWRHFHWNWGFFEVM
jgi:hypothetical protein